MTISEATQAGIARLTRPEWAWTNFIELYLTENDGKRHHGPWAYLASIGVEPTQIAVWELPQDDAYVAWSVPDEMRDFYEKEAPENIKRSLWSKA